MRTKLAVDVLVCVVVLILGGVTVATAAGIAFTYQGSLSDAGAAAEGAYDFEFRLYDALADGTQVSSTVALVEAVAADRYLARLWPRVMASTITVSEAEARAWYDDHLEEFTERPVVSYLIAWLNDADAAADARAEVAALLDSGTDVSQTKVETSNYLIVYEAQFSNAPDPGLGQLLLEVEPGVVSGPHTFPSIDRPVMISLVGRSGGTTTPFEQVEITCHGQMRAQKLAEMTDPHLPRPIMAEHASTPANRWPSVSS